MQYLVTDDVPGTRDLLALKTISHAALRRQVSALEKRVLTFAGYSGAGYEDPDVLEHEVRRVLAAHDPADTVVNVGATEVGIGCVYEIAKELGFDTIGIVSSQALAYPDEISRYCDEVYFVQDASWGGIDAATGRLSPTSQAIVDVSDVFVSIGGGAVAADEFRAMRERGKRVEFIAADMNHQKAIEKAREKGKPEPTDFRGEVFLVADD